MASNAKRRRRAAAGPAGQPEPVEPQAATPAPSEPAPSQEPTSQQGSTEPPEAAPPREPAERGMFRSFQDVTGVLAFGAVTAYAIAYYFQYSFYREFGLTPDQVGVDKVGALLRLVPTVLVVIAFAGFVVSVLWGTGLPIVQTQLRLFRAFFGSGKQGLLIGAAVLLIAAYPAFLFVPPGWGIPLSVLLVFGTGVLALLSRASQVERKRITLAALAIGVTIGVWLTSDWIAQGARDLKATGNYARRFGLVGIPLDHASVRWIDATRRPASIAEPNTLVIINQSASGYALYDCRTGRTHVVAVADIVVERAVEPRGTNRAEWLRTQTGCAQRP